ncbi:MAG TPA: hypothetical protein VHO90_10385 [Bacteroidales bacterium]|nr:hypothetical protein [Bacteroidales bacterium]
MKTQKIIPIVVAIMTVIIFSLEAQNTKSVDNPQDIVFDKENASAHTDLPHVPNMKTLSRSPLLVRSSKFGPNKYDLLYIDQKSREVMDDITNKLMKEIKYLPEASIINTSDATMRFEEMMRDLERDVRYKPADSVVDPLNENSGVFNEIAAALEKDVKYKPTLIP